MNLFFVNIKVTFILFRVFLKNHYLLFLGLICNIHDVPYWANALRQFCSPVFDRGSIIKSSAYKREFNLVPLGKTNGSDRILSKEKGKSLMYRLNRSGLRMQPWRTPLAY